MSGVIAALSSLFTCVKLSEDTVKIEAEYPILNFKSEFSKSSKENKD
jgi:hypothetical protein